MKAILFPMALVLLQAPAPAGLTYRFDEVHHSVHQWPGGDPARDRSAAPGDAAASGDVVRTGWWGRTILSVPARGSRFEVLASTQVRLAGGEPGVLLMLEKGRIKAFFDALVDGGRQERRIAVPGALLAVRGTRYGVDVDAHGRATLSVFEGVVEVLPKGPDNQPFKVKAGEWSSFGPGMQVQFGSMGAQGFQERMWDQGMHPEAGMGSGSMNMGGAMHGGMPVEPGSPMHR